MATSILESGRKSKNLTLLGLVLAAIAPTVSVVTGFVIQAGIIAVFVFIITKIWMFGLPAFWHLKVENKPFSASKVANGGWRVSLLLGTAMSLVIYLAYAGLGEIMISAENLKSILQQVGLTRPSNLLLAIVFWIFVNSVLEEYLFRWFILSKLEQLIDNNWLSMILSSIIFMVHHTIALAFFISPAGNLLCSLGLFIGGLVFAWLYLQYRSIWIPWLAHALCDVAVFSIAWHLIIGF